MAEDNNFLKNEVTGKVVDVDNSNLTLEILNGEKAILSKKNMYVSKKKKLTDIFSLGFLIKATIIGKKEDYYILSQKELDSNKSAEKEEKNKDLEQKKNKKTSKKDKKTTKKNNFVKKENLEQGPQNNEQKNVLEKEEIAEEIPNDITLKGLKKLKYIGNMKISLAKNKKISSQKEDEEKIELPKAPEGLLENIEKTTKEATAKYAKLTEKLQEKGYL